jgi:hypothetical protein
MGHLAPVPVEHGHLGFGIRQVAGDQPVAEDALRPRCRQRAEDRSDLTGSHHAASPMGAVEACSECLAREMSCPAERVTDGHQLVRRQDGRQVEQCLWAARHPQPAVADDVLGPQPAHVDPDVSSLRSGDPGRHDDLERPCRRHRCPQHPGGGQMREGGPVGQHRRGRVTGVQERERNRARHVGAAGHPDAVVPQFRSRQPGGGRRCPAVRRR